MSQMERVQAWLTHNGYQVQQQRTGGYVVRVQRRKGGPKRISITIRSGVVYAVPHCKAHRSAALESLVREFNESEQWVSGPQSDKLDARIAATLAGLPDFTVQSMADWYATQPRLTLGDVHGPEAPTLTSLVTRLRYIDAYVSEAQRRATSEVSERRTA